MAITSTMTRRHDVALSQSRPVDVSQSILAQPRRPAINPLAPPHRQGVYIRRRLPTPKSPLSSFRAQNIDSTPIMRMNKETQRSTETEYGPSIMDSMLQSEDRTRPNVETIDQQPELQWYMRPYLIDFLIEVHSQYNMTFPSLHHAINIVDRYVSRRVVFKKHFQLVGCAALWIATKADEHKEKVPTLDELIQFCCKAYEREMFCQMEIHVLQTLEYTSHCVTAAEFLEHCLLASEMRASAEGETDNQQTVDLARFLTDLSLFSREFLLFKPSVVAEASLVLARHILNQVPFYADLVDLEVDECVQIFMRKLPTASNILRKKYRNAGGGDVSPIIEGYLAQQEELNARRAGYANHTVLVQQQGGFLTPGNTPNGRATVKTPVARAKALEDYRTPPHTPTNPHDLPVSVLANSKSSHIFANNFGLPTPPMDHSTSNSSSHEEMQQKNPYRGGTYGRSESFMASEIRRSDDDDGEIDVDAEYEYDREGDETMDEYSSAEEEGDFIMYDEEDDGEYTEDEE